VAQRSASRELTPFSTDPNAELPVGLQLSWRLRALIATGRLSAGERLPSFRQLAEWGGVNVNTVRTVYSGLEEAGLVVSRQGQGTFVDERIEPAPELEEIAADALRRVIATGFDPRDLVAVTAACVSMGEEGGVGVGVAEGELPDLDKESEAIEVRHELRRQIARLEIELAAYTRDLPDNMPTAASYSKAHVAGVEELERTRDTLISQLSEAQRAAEMRARQIGEERARREALLAEEEGEAPPRSSGGPLGRAMSWWQAKS
jgi:DNA-binding transcriptional regulator YhcF (GntR family)